MDCRSSIRRSPQSVSDQSAVAVLGRGCWQSCVSRRARPARPTTLSPRMNLQFDDERRWDAVGSGALVGSVRRMDRPRRPSQFAMPPAYFVHVASYLCIAPVHVHKQAARLRGERVPSVARIFFDFSGIALRRTLAYRLQRSSQSMTTAVRRMPNPLLVIGAGTARSPLDRRKLSAVVVMPFRMAAHPCSPSDAVGERDGNAGRIRA